MNATEVGVHAPPNGPRDSTILTGPESLSAFRLEPLDPKKVADLWINWDNVVVRERDGRYQLAYGHHRIEAARQELGPDAIVRVIVRNLDDMMIRVMLDENSVDVKLTGQAVVEAVADTGILALGVRSYKLVDKTFLLRLPPEACSAVQTLAAMARHAGNDLPHTMWASSKTLANEAHCSAATFFRHVAWLTKHDLITPYTRRGSFGGRFRRHILPALCAI